MRNFSSLLFMGGFAFLILSLTTQLPLGQPIMVVGEQVTNISVHQVHTANVVAAILLAYRGIDTLGELSILFSAAAGIGLILTQLKNTSIESTPTQSGSCGFLTMNAANLMMPLLLIVGFYVIFYGHVTPGGGFQGGVVLAIAFFLPVLVGNRTELNHNAITLIEGLAGGGFIIIGLLALFSGNAFLQPFLDTFLGNGPIGSLWSAGSLPILYLAVGLKVGAELAGLLTTIAQYQELLDDRIV